MPVIRIQCAFQPATAVPEDVITNTWHMFDEAGISNPTNMANIVWDFYSATYAGAPEGPVVNWFSEEAFSGVMNQRLYNLSDPEPRQPILEVERTFTPNASDTLPQEVAVCLSYQAAPESGVNQARRRGRIYIGPLRLGANDSGRPATGLLTTLGVAAGEMLAAANASVNERWVVYSPTAGTSATVVGGWVDNAFDTQRRRGWAASQRYPWAEA